MRPSMRPAIAFMMFVAPLVLHSKAEILSVSGKGSVAIPASKKQERARNEEAALDRAESLALESGLEQAVLQVYGPLGEKRAAVLSDLAAQSGSIVLFRQVLRSTAEGDRAEVELFLKVNAEALSSFLRDKHGLSLSLDAGGETRVLVLSYTIEGMDPDLTKPVVLHEEVRDDRSNVRASSQSHSASSSSSSSSAVSVQARSATSDKGSASAEDRGSFSAAGSSRMSVRDSFGSAHLSDSASAAGSSSSKASADWDRRASASIDARGSEAHARASHSASSSSSYSDTSTFYHRVVDYADPTKKGAGVSNEVRAGLEGLMQMAGLRVQAASVDLMGRDFKNEDELLKTARREAALLPGVRGNDYLLVGLNRFTPADTGGHRFTSQITYRLLRIRDGELLLPSKILDGDSGPQPSDDLGRTRAVKEALKKAEAAMPREIREAAKHRQRLNNGQVAQFLVKIANSQHPSNSLPMRQALKAAGFQFSHEFKGDAQTETLRIDIIGKSVEQLKELIEPLTSKFEIRSMDDREWSLWAK